MSFRLSVSTNLFFENGTNSIGTATYNDIIGDPLFVDSTEQDFRLQVGSPAIDVGEDLSSAGVVFDADGNARCDGSYDLGAFEFSYYPSGMFFGRHCRRLEKQSRENPAAVE